MTTSLLKTKLFIPPLRQGLVPRPRLVARLNAGLGGELTLVSAPAGFGKTTLLSAWVRQHEEAASNAAHPPARHFAWVSLDASDNDPVRFWRYVVAALCGVSFVEGRGMDAPFGSMAKTESSPASLEALVTGLVNEVVAHYERRGQAHVLVLDDYHVIEAEHIHTSLDYLLDHLPPPLHVVIASRADPPLSLSRRRGRGVLTEIRTADLRFSGEEAAAFLGNVAGLDLSAQDIATLEERTEGWPAGLQMAALSLRGREDFVAAFAGDDRYVGDYLLEEVLQRQPPHIQGFLLQTSILERLNGPLCDAVVGERGGSQAILERLDSSNLFIVPLDNRRHWYRYHRLFADLLHRRLEEKVGAQGLAALHLRASAWHESEGLIDDAIRHAIAATDWQRAAALIERHGLALVFRSEVVLVRDWLQKLPERLLRSNPALCIIEAWARAFTSGPTQALEQTLCDAQEAHQDDARLGAWVNGQVAAIRAVMARQRGQAPQAVRDLTRQALEHIPRDDLRLRGNLNFNLAWAHFQLGDEEAGLRAWDETQGLGLLPGGDLFMALVAVYGKAQLARVHGRLGEAAAICQEALETIVEPKEQARERIPVAGSLYIGLGGVMLEWNALEKAERLLHKGLDLISWTGETSRLSGLAAMARLRQAQGDDAGARAALGTLQTWLPERASYAAACTWFGWAGDNPRTVYGEWDPYVEDVVMAPARIERRRTSDLACLSAALREMLEQAQEKQWTELAIELAALESLALQALGQTEAALVSLKRALAWAEPGGYVRLFLDKGPVMVELLAQAAARGVAVDYANRLLAASPPGQRTTQRFPSSSAHRPSSAPFETLTRRELEVLRCLAGGLSNKEIAGQLVIAVATVKQHLKHIYSKLDVHNRTQAINRARDLDLL